MNVTLMEIENGLAAMRTRYEQARGRRDLLLDQRASKADALDRVRRDIDVWRQVQMLFTKVSEYARQQLKSRIEETVTAALQAVFADDGLRFEIEIRELAGKPAAEWRVVSRYVDTELSTDPEDARGGGIVDVVSLALRLALMELSRPKPGGPLLLDEVGKHVSGEYAPNVAFFLKEYARKTGRQVILVTHQAALAEVADKSYRVNKAADSGQSEVRPA